MVLCPSSSAGQCVPEVACDGIVRFRSHVFDVCGMMVNRAVVRWWLSKESRDATIISTD